MDKNKRKYYNKREKRMYGLDDDNGIDGKLKNAKEYVELNQQVVKLKTLHKREEELYFYDAFAYPWEKDKHYKMVYQLEKKFFPDHCFDKAFCEPGDPKNENVTSKKKGETKDDKGLVFFEEKGVVGDDNKDVKMDVTEKKVEEFFKCLKKVPDDVDSGMPFVSGRSCGLPPKWDGPNGAVMLVNKPKGWTSFTVCGKLRRLVNVKKTGIHHALNPDPYRGIHGSDGPKYAKDVDEIIMYGTSGRIAGFISEAIQGVGGIYELAPGYLPEVYNSVRKAGGLCIADEVQTGFARTGSHFWGFEAQGVVPDIITLAKVVFFTNSGTEANELALLIARLYTGSHDIISLRNGYHGNASATTAATAQRNHKYNVVQTGIHHALNPDPYRGIHGSDGPKYAKDVDEIIMYGTSGRIAGFISEAIQVQFGIYEMRL